MHILYPPIQPYRQENLPVDGEHTLYIEECGNPDGIPVLFLHGGPGSGCSESDRRFFDPEKYRIVLFDQRGAGRSKPSASLIENTTPHLIQDIEEIRQFLGIECWVLFGGSWGATLALLYAQQHSERILGMILRGVFLCRPQDLAWLYQRGASLVFPDYWRDFIQPIFADERHDMIDAYYRVLTGSNDLAKMNAAKQWSIWEGRCATLRSTPSLVNHFSEPRLALSMARIEAHFFVNNGFITDNQILDNMQVLADIPATIVHGRYDIICPLDNAVALHQAWPNADLCIVREAGHASREPGITDALIRASNEMIAVFEKE